MNMESKQQLSFLSDAGGAGIIAVYTIKAEQPHAVSQMFGAELEKKLGTRPMAAVLVEDDGLGSSEPVLSAACFLGLAEEDTDVLFINIDGDSGISTDDVFSSGLPVWEVLGRYRDHGMISDAGFRRVRNEKFEYYVVPPDCTGKHGLPDDGKPGHNFREAFRAADIFIYQMYSVGKDFPVARNFIISAVSAINQALGEDLALSIPPAEDISCSNSDLHDGLLFAGHDGGTVAASFSAAETIISAARFMDAFEHHASMEFAPQLGKLDEDMFASMLQALGLETEVLRRLLSSADPYSYMKEAMAAFSSLEAPKSERDAAARDPHPRSELCRCLRGMYSMAPSMFMDLIVRPALDSVPFTADDDMDGAEPVPELACYDAVPGRWGLAFSTDGGTGELADYEYDAACLWLTGKVPDDVTKLLFLSGPKDESGWISPVFGQLQDAFADIAGQAGIDVVYDATGYLDVGDAGLSEVTSVPEPRDGCLGELFVKDRSCLAAEVLPVLSRIQGRMLATQHGEQRSSTTWGPTLSMMDAEALSALSLGNASADAIGKLSEDPFAKMDYAGAAYWDAVSDIIAPPEYDWEGLSDELNDLLLLWEATAQEHGFTLGYDFPYNVPKPIVSILSSDPILVTRVRAYYAGVPCSDIVGDMRYSYK